MNQNVSESLDVKKGVHVFMSSAFSTNPVSVGVFSHFDNFVSLSCNSDFQIVRDYAKDYLCKRFAASVCFWKSRMVGPETVEFIFRVDPYNGDTVVDFPVRVFAA